MELHGNERGEGLRIARGSNRGKGEGRYLRDGWHRAPDHDQSGIVCARSAEFPLTVLKAFRELCRHGGRSVYDPQDAASMRGL